MKTKKYLKNSSFGLLFVVLLLPVVAWASCSLASVTNSCSGLDYPVGLTVSVFVYDLLYVFIAMMLWAVSPVGILFYVALKLYFSKNPSRIKLKISSILQSLSFITWFSAMLILFFLYLDSVTYHIFHAGGFVLNLAIRSGLGFMLFMLLLVYIEKRLASRKKENLDYEKIKENKCENSSEKNENNIIKEDIKEKKVKAVKKTKSAGPKKKGIKEKVKNIIKEDIKEILDDEIDKL